MSDLPAIPEIVAAISTHNDSDNLAEHYTHDNTHIQIIANSASQINLTLPYYEELNQTCDSVSDEDMLAVTGGTSDTSMPTPVFFSRFFKISKIIDATLQGTATTSTSSDPQDTP